MSELGIGPTQFATEAGVADNTFRAFMDRRSWPRIGTMAKLETRLGWPGGSIEDVARGAEPPPPADRAASAGQPARQPLAAVPDVGSGAPSPAADDTAAVGDSVVITVGTLTIRVQPAPGMTAEDVLRDRDEFVVAALETLARMRRERQGRS